MCLHMGMDQEQHRSISAFNVIAAGTGIAALGGLGWFIAEPGMLSLGFTVASLIGYGISRQISVHTGDFGDSDIHNQSHSR